MNRLSGKHFPALDGIRGIAILSVLLVHSQYATERLALPAASKILEFGAYGVDLFFALSGFLITGILLDTKNSTHYFLSFYARRTLRLFPAYYGYLIAVATAVPLIHRIVHTSMPDYSGPWWWYLAYISNWKHEGGAADPYLGHFWSLAVEEQYYLCWSILVWLSPSRRHVAWTSGVLAVLALAIRIYLFHSHADWEISYRTTPARLDVLAIGSLAAVAIRSPAARAVNLIRLARMAGCAAGILFIVLAALSGGAEWSHQAIGTIGGTLLAICFGAFVLSTAKASITGAHQPLLTHPVLTTFGKYSYGIYVLHILIFAHVSWVAEYISNRAPAENGVLWSLTIPVSICMSYAAARASWWMLEEPCLRMKRFFPY